MDWGPLRMVALVAVGGGLGSALRYVVSGLVTRGEFPWGTFAVNFSGTFGLTLLFFAFLSGGSLTPDLRTFVFIGVFGGYTTFSTFGLETVSLFAEGAAWWGAVNIMLNGGLCLAGAFVGRVVGLWVGGG